MPSASAARHPVEEHRERVPSGVADALRIGRHEQAIIGEARSQLGAQHTALGRLVGIDSVQLSERYKQLTSTFAHFADLVAKLFSRLDDLLPDIASRARRSYSFQAWITSAGTTARTTRISTRPVEPIGARRRTERGLLSDLAALRSALDTRLRPGAVRSGDAGHEPPAFCCRRAEVIAL